MLYLSLNYLYTLNLSHCFSDVFCTFQTSGTRFTNSSFLVTQLIHMIHLCYSFRASHWIGIQEMGLWTLLEGCLLIANALAILNEDRFLAPRGWSFQEYSGVKRNSLKGQIIGLIYATQYLRVLLMILNSLCIVVKLVSGWFWFFSMLLQRPYSLPKYMF